MSILSRFRRRKSPYAAVTEEEQIARYVYLLNTLPASVIESAHATAFRSLPAEKRRELFEQLRPFMADGEREAASDDPIVLAKLLRRAEERRAARTANAGGGAATVTAGSSTAVGVVDPRDGIDPRDVMTRSGLMASVSGQFLTTAAVAVYFTAGAGSLVIADQPGWVGDTYDPGAGFDGGGYGGGGFDGGGFGGGFDGGGFGGGFDGGGGFGG